MNWHGKRVLVTGADGFIGSHLTESLVREGASVRAFCLYNSSGSRGWIDALDGDVQSVLDVRLGDIRDARFVESACRDVDIVFHLAALIAIPYSYSAPDSYVETNVRGTLNVLEGVRRASVQRFVNTSTSEVYGTPATLPIRETHPLVGQSPYSATKIAADMLVESYFCSFATPAVTLRPFNTYGPRQSARAIIPTILSQLLSGAREVRLGNIAPRRDLTFVSDTVSGFLAAGSVPGLEGRTIQLGTGRTESVADLFAAATHALGVDARIVQDSSRLRPDRSEVMVLQSDPRLAEELLGWRAVVALEEGLLQTAHWIERHMELYRPKVYAV